MTPNTSIMSIPEDEPMETTLISAAQGAALTGVTIGTWWEWSRSISDFPRPIRITSRCTRWQKVEVLNWLASRRQEQ